MPGELLMPTPRPGSQPEPKTGEKVVRWTQYYTSSQVEKHPEWMFLFTIIPKVLFGHEQHRFPVKLDDMVREYNLLLSRSESTGLMLEIIIPLDCSVEQFEVFMRKQFEIAKFWLERGTGGTGVVIPGRYRGGPRDRGGHRGQSPFLHHDGNLYAELGPDKVKILRGVVNDLVDAGREEIANDEGLEVAELGKRVKAMQKVFKNVYDTRGVAGVETLDLLAVGNSETVCESVEQLKQLLLEGKTIIQILDNGDVFVDGIKLKIPGLDTKELKEIMLQGAVRKDNIAEVKWLVKEGVDVNAKVDDKTALDYAQSADMVELLLLGGAEDTIWIGKNNGIIYIGGKNLPELEGTEGMIIVGIDGIPRIGKDGFPELLLLDGVLLDRVIAVVGNDGISRINGRSLDVNEEKLSEIRLRAAAYFGKLLEAGKLITDETVNAIGVGGKTALHYAVENESVKMVRLLKARGARSDIADKEGKTPLDLELAKETSDPELLILLSSSAAEAEAEPLAKRQRLAISCDGAGGSGSRKKRGAGLACIDSNDKEDVTKDEKVEIIEGLDQSGELKTIEAGIRQAKKATVNPASVELARNILEIRNNLWSGADTTSAIRELLEKIKETISECLVKSGIGNSKKIKKEIERKVNFPNLKEKLTDIIKTGNLAKILPILNESIKGLKNLEPDQRDEFYSKVKEKIEEINEQFIGTIPTAGKPLVVDATTMSSSRNVKSKQSDVQRIYPERQAFVGIPVRTELGQNATRNTTLRFFGGAINNTIESSVGRESIKHVNIR